MIEPKILRTFSLKPSKENSLMVDSNNISSFVESSQHEKVESKFKVQKVHFKKTEGLNTTEIS